MTSETLVGALPGTVMKHARALTSASLTSRSGLAPGRRFGDGVDPLPRAGAWALERPSRGKRPGPRLRMPGFASVTPQGRSGTRLGVRSADCHGSAVKVRREHRWNATFGFT